MIAPTAVHTPSLLTCPGRLAVCNVPSYPSAFSLLSPDQPMINIVLCLSCCADTDSWQSLELTGTWDRGVLLVIAASVNYKTSTLLGVGVNNLWISIVDFLLTVVVFQDGIVCKNSNALQPSVITTTRYWDFYGALLCSAWRRDVWFSHVSPKTVFLISTPTFWFRRSYHPFCCSERREHVLNWQNIYTLNEGVN